MKTKVINAVMATRLLQGAKSDKMQKKDRHALIRIIRAMKPVAENYDALLKEAGERLKPEGFDAMVEKEQRGEAFTPEEQETLRRYNEEIAECVKVEQEREVEISCETLSEEAVLDLQDANPDWTLGTVDELMAMLCAPADDKNANAGEEAAEDHAG